MGSFAEGGYASYRELGVAMSVSVPVADSTEIARAFAEGYARGEAPKVAFLLAPDVDERELVPRGFIDQRGRDAVIAEATEFLGPFRPPEVLQQAVEPLGPLVRWSLRWRLRSDRATWLVEWHAFLTVEGGVITKIDAVCSGLVPENVA